MCSYIKEKNVQPQVVFNFGNFQSAALIKFSYKKKRVVSDKVPSWLAPTSHEIFEEYSTSRTSINLNECWLFSAKKWGGGGLSSSWTTCIKSISRKHEYKFDVVYCL